MRSGTTRVARRVTIAVLAVWIAGLLGAGVFVVLTRNQVTPIGLESTVERYRKGAIDTGAPQSGSEAANASADPGAPTADAGAPPAAQGQGGTERPAAARTTGPKTTAPTQPGPAAARWRPRPADGVYTYKTTGFESLSVYRHEYPDETHAVVEHGGGACDWTMRHLVIEEHTDFYGNCNTETSAMPRWVTHREFAGVSLDEPYGCTGDPFLAAGEPKGVVSLHCQSEEDEDLIDLRFDDLGTASLQVGSEAVEARHLKGEGRIEGNPSGTMTVELWLHPSTGLRLKEKRSVAADVQASAMSGEYREEVEFVLVSLSPKR